MSWFVATAGGAETIDGALVVVLAEAWDRGTRIEFQRALSFDPQDKALGMDTYCLCTETGTHYGGVEAWRISHGYLHLSLNDSAAKALGLESEFAVELQLPEKTVDTVTAGIHRALNLTMSA